MKEKALELAIKIKELRTELYESATVLANLQAQQSAIKLEFALAAKDNEELRNETQRKAWIADQLTDSHEQKRLNDQAQRLQELIQEREVDLEYRRNLLRITLAYATHEIESFA